MSCIQTSWIILKNVFFSGSTLIQLLLHMSFEQLVTHIHANLQHYRI